MSPPAASVTYAKLADALRRGLYPASTRLPGERDLAAQLGVSRSTLRQALTRLADEGQLQRSSQRGWYVRPAVVGEPPSVLQSFSEMALARGLKPTSQILRQQVRAATFEEAELLHIAPATPVLEVHRVRGLDAVPICVDTSVVVGSGLADADLEDRSLYEALETVCGIVVARSAYSVQAQAASASDAELLRVEEGSPVLVGREVTYDLAQTPVLTSATVYRGDAYRFQADLFRPLS